MVEIATSKPFNSIFHWRIVKQAINSILKTVPELHYCMHVIDFLKLYMVNLSQHECKVYIVCSFNLFKKDVLKNKLSITLSLVFI